MSQKHEPSRREFLTQTGALLFADALSHSESLATGPPATTVGREEGKVPVIDCHAHCGIAQGVVYSWDTVGDVEEILRNADEAGVDKTIIFPLGNKSYKKSNEYIAQMCQRYPEKLIGYAWHSAQTENYPVHDLLVHEVHDLGLRGLKLHDQPSKEILDTVKELGIPVIAHLERMRDWEEFLPYYPTINFVVAHLGSDNSFEVEEHLAAIDLAKRYPNVYLENSAVLLTKYIEMAIEQLGPEKVLLGSDAPDVDVRRTIFQIRVLKLPKEHEQMILGGNMLRLLGGRA